MLMVDPRRFEKMELHGGNCMMRDRNRLCVITGTVCKNGERHPNCPAVEVDADGCCDNYKDRLITALRDVVISKYIHNTVAGDSASQFVYDMKMKNLLAMDDVLRKQMTDMGVEDAVG